MNLEQWIHALPARLELGADVVDDVANSDWVSSDDDRERLFGVEAQIWRIAQRTRAAAADPGAILPFLERSLRAARSNLRMWLKLPVCEGEGVRLLEGLCSELDQAIDELQTREEHGCRAAVGGRP